jgi:hypothetical protein
MAGTDLDPRYKAAMLRQLHELGIAEATEALRWTPEFAAAHAHARWVALHASFAAWACAAGDLAALALAREAVALVLREEADAFEALDTEPDRAMAAALRAQADKGRPPAPEAN